MAIQLTNGFSTFDAFVKFAENRSSAGLKGDVAKATLELDDRRISVATVGSASKTSAAWLSRTGDDKITPDGRTAVLTMRMQSPIMMGHAANEDEGFGQMQIAQKLTIDLTPDVPVVTDVKISQYINS